MLDDFGIHSYVVDKPTPATLIFVAGHYDDPKYMPVMADGNQIGSFALKYYSDRTSFEKCLQVTLKNQTGEITALLIDEKNDMTTVMPLGDAQSICTASLVAQCGLFSSTTSKRPALVN